MSRLFWLCLLLLLSFSASAGPLVQFRTVLGDIDVELEDDKPVTTQNFLGYVQRGDYQNTFFHRLVPGFIVQGGGYLVLFRGTPFASFVRPPEYPSITNEFNVGRKLSNNFGTLAMAKTEAGPDTAAAEWFFNLANNSTNLDNQNGGFTVFGHIVRGTNILQRFNNPAAATNHIFIYNFGEPFTSLPVLTTNAAYDDLIYMDISLLNVQVKLGTNKVRQISWKSVAGKTNFVEYTLFTNKPPTWFNLATTNGNGTNYMVTDSSTNNSRRFYRVRVAY
ncbi:MAG: peptidyl-prolyl cis-trans isomerase cyclophilin type [Verrucomicrobiales bacterium]|nr:peptidyl-prolyl cis-trans isomerase cyclophilin type [Verrucomicrobiales bacterium]